MFTLTPDATSSIAGTGRRPRYISPSTASIAIVLNGSGTATFLNLADPAQCDAAKKCSVSVAAPSGTDTFVVSAYSAANGTGALLSRATVQATITPNGTNVVPVVLNGDVASIIVTLANGTPSLHQVTTDALTVIAKDAKNNTIVGPGGYLYPITLTDSDTSGHSSLTKTTLNGPGDTVALQYDGGYGSGSVTASALGNATASVPFVPKITMTETVLPGGRLPSGIIAGPDGALWFVDGPQMLGRMTTLGTLTEFAAPVNWNPRTLCAGPDGNIWFLAQSTQSANVAIVRRATSDGTYTVFPVGTPPSFAGCVAGPDGNLYATVGSSIVQVTPSGSTATLTLQDARGATHWGWPIAGSPDTALWFVDAVYDAIDRYDLVTHAVTVNLVQPPGVSSGPPGALTPREIVAGPNRRFSFSLLSGAYTMDMSGVTTTIYTPSGGDAAGALAVTSDGALWINTFALNQPFPTFLHLSGTTLTPLVGTVALSGLTFRSVGSMAAASDGSLWYTRNGAIGKMVP